MFTFDDDKKPKLNVWLDIVLPVGMTFVGAMVMKLGERAAEALWPSKEDGGGGGQSVRIEVVHSEEGASEEESTGEDDVDGLLKTSALH